MDKAYEVWTNLEEYTTYYPAVFKEVRIAERNGNEFVTEEIAETMPGVRIEGRGRHLLYPPDRYIREHLIGDLAGTAREQVFESLPGGRSKVTMRMRMVIGAATLEAMGDSVIDNAKGVNARQMEALACHIEGRDHPAHPVVETPVIAFHTGGFCDEPLETVLPAIRDAGFDAVELNAETLPWCGPHIRPGMSDSDVERIVALLNETKLTVTSICAHIPMIEAAAESRANALAYVKGCIDLAPRFGTDVVHALSGVLPDQVEPADGWRWLTESIEECAAHAQEQGVRFAIEPVTGMLVATTADLVRLKEQVSAPVYVNFDPSHLLVEGDDLVAAIRHWGDDIVHVHIKDARGTPGDFAFPPLGQGTIDFDAFFGALRDIGYTGACSVEDEAHAFGFPFEPRVTARESARFLRAGTGVKP